MGNEWLAKLKPGDEVMEMWDDRITKVSTVLKFTKTQIVLGSGEAENRYRKKDGRAVGHSDEWHSWYILPLDKDRLNEQKRKLKLSTFRGILSDYKTWRFASDETVMKCYAICFPKTEADNANDRE